MRVITKIWIGAIAVLHLYIAWFEIFAWQARGPKVFSVFPPELFAQTTIMAANQGIYNAFLAAGLLWALCIRELLWQRRVATCFLIFVAVAGVFGAISGITQTIFVQTVPAGIALATLWLTRLR